MNDWIEADYPEFAFKRVTITSGEKRNSRNWLMRNLIRWISKPNFFISTDVEGADTLKEQIIGLKAERTKAGVITYETATQHDDYLMSLALCLSALQKPVTTTQCDVFFKSWK